MWAMRQHKHLRRAEGWLVAPRTLGNVEGAPPQHTRSQSFGGFFKEEFCVGVGSAVEYPFMQYPAAIAQAIAGAIIRPGDKTVQRHGDVYNYFAHSYSSDRKSVV